MANFSLDRRALLALGLCATLTACSSGDIEPMSDASNAISDASSDEVLVTLVLQFRDGTLEGVLEKLMPAVKLTRTEPGNLAFDVFKVQGAQDRLFIFERWKNQTVLDAHFKEPYTVEALALFEKNLVRPLVVGEDVRYVEDAVKMKI
jgi:quinol monooxygenase YgiN